ADCVLINSLTTFSPASNFSASCAITMRVARRDTLLDRSSTNTTVARFGSSVYTALVLAGPAMKYAAGPRKLHPAIVSVVSAAAESTALWSRRLVDELRLGIDGAFSACCAACSVLRVVRFLMVVERPGDAVEEP